MGTLRVIAYRQHQHPTENGTDFRPGGILSRSIKGLSHAIYNTPNIQGMNLLSIVSLFRYIEKYIRPTGFTLLYLLEEMLHYNGQFLPGQQLLRPKIAFK